MTIDTLQVKLMSIIVHLIEHIDSQSWADYRSAQGLLADQEVEEAMRDAYTAALLPMPRHLPCDLERIFK